MSMFARADHSATPCTFCGAFEGPFLTCGVEAAGGRNIIVCAEIVGPDGGLVRAGCAANIANADGGLGRYEAQQLRDDNKRLSAEHAALEEKLAHIEQPIKVVALEDLRAILDNAPNANAELSRAR